MHNISGMCGAKECRILILKWQNTNFVSVAKYLPGVAYLPMLVVTKPTGSISSVRTVMWLYIVSNVVSRLWKYPSGLWKRSIWSFTREAFYRQRKTYKWQAAASQTKSNDDMPKAHAHLHAHTRTYCWIMKSDFNPRWLTWSPRMIFYLGNVNEPCMNCMRNIECMPGMGWKYIKFRIPPAE